MQLYVKLWMYTHMNNKVWPWQLPVTQQNKSQNSC